MTCNYFSSYFYCVQDFQVSTTLQSPNTLYPSFFLRFDILRFSPQEEHLHFPTSVHTFPHQSDNVKPLDFIKGELEKLRLDHGPWEWPEEWENPQRVASDHPPQGLSLEAPCELIYTHAASLARKNASPQNTSLPELSDVKIHVSKLSISFPFPSAWGTS